MALLLIVVVGVLMAEGLALLGARSGMVEQMSAASKRRIVLENSKALAQEFMLEHVATSSSGSAFEYSLPDASWGGITVPAWNNASMLSVQKASGVNYFNPGNGDGFAGPVIGPDATGLDVTVRDGDANLPLRKYQVKSRSPLLAGTLLSIQTPTLNTTATVSIGSLSVGGGAFVWQPNLAMTFTPNSYAVPDGATAVTFTNSAGATVLPSNLALPRQIANPRTGGTAFYVNGQLDAIVNDLPAANSSKNKATSGGSITVIGSQVHPAPSTPPAPPDGVVCDGAYHVTITLSTPELGNVYIPGEIDTLTLVGQAAANDAAADDLPAVLIVIDEPSTTTHPLTSITLNQHNSRRLDLAVKRAAPPAGSLPVQFATTGATWRLLLEMENTPVALTTTGIVTIQGGIRSDRAIALTGGMRLTLESDPKNLERLATRTAWIEGYVP